MEILINRYVPNGIFGSSHCEMTHHTSSSIKNSEKKQKKNHLYHMELKWFELDETQDKAKQRKKYITEF